MDGFYYFICNPDFEKLLKEEIKVRYPKLLFAYSQKGFVTYKQTFEIEDDLAFCRSMGMFIKRGGTELILDFKKHTGAKSFFSLDGEIYETSNLENGSEVLELIKLSDDKFYLGKTFKKSRKKYYPLGDPKIVYDESSPSRAYMKILEAMAVFDVEVDESDVVVEFGSSPGGATYAMLQNGATVIGIDPGVMDPKVLAFTKFTHINKAIQDVKKSELPEKIDWVLVDMNLSPEAGINELEQLLPSDTSKIKGIFFTTKVTKNNVIGRIEFYKKLFTKMGFRQVQTLQVPHHKQEFLIFATH